MSRVLFAAAAAALLSSTALAADITAIEPAPVEAPVPTGFDWSGLYAGGFVGYGWADVEVDDVDGYNVGIDGDDFAYEADGFYAGSLIGYNIHWDAFLLGIEAEIGRLELEEEAQAPSRDGILGDSIASVDIDTFGNISGRLGLVWDRWMLYGKGGLAFADVEVEFEDANPAGGATLIDGTEEDDWLWGYTFGGGVEVAVLNGWTVRGEYMFTDLEEISHVATEDDADEWEFEHDLENIHTVKLGVTRRF